MLPGVDTNHWRGPSNFRAVANAGYKFAYLRATYGVAEDGVFVQDRVSVLGAGLPYGAYHYLTALHNPLDQARRFTLTAGRGGQLPPWLDVEDSGVTLTQVTLWLNEFERLTGRGDSIIYTRANIWDGLSRSNPALAATLAMRHRLAVAHYGAAQPALPQSWLLAGKRWTFWQHSDGGNVPGVTPPTDLNWFNGNLEELLTMADEYNLYQIITIKDSVADTQVRALLNAVVDIDGATLTALRKVAFAGGEPPTPPPAPQPLWRGRAIGALRIRDRNGAPAKDPATNSDILPNGTSIDVWEVGRAGGWDDRLYYQPDKNLNVWGALVVRIGATGGGAGLQLRWPVDKSFDSPVASQRVTQLFGANPEAYAPFGLPGHEGIDLEANSGANVYAAADGVVTDLILPVEPDWRKPGGHPYGRHVRILHTSGNRRYKTVYAHLLNTEIAVGDRVTAGQLIGHADNTGNSSGDHLHFGVYEQDANGKRIEALPGYNGYFDPLPLLYFPS